MKKVVFFLLFAFTIQLAEAQGGRRWRQYPPVYRGGFNSYRSNTVRTFIIGTFFGIGIQGSMNNGRHYRPRYEWCWVQVFQRYDCNGYPVYKWEQQLQRVN